MLQIIQATLLGLCAGSFMNVVAFRLPEALLANKPLNLTGPRSACPDCKHTIGWYDNIPLISWCALRGRCRHCKYPVSLRYPLTELLCGLACLALSILLPEGYMLIASALFCLILIALVQIDIRYQLLPDLLTYTLMWTGMLSSAAGILPLELLNSVTGAAAGYLTLWILRAFFMRLRKQEGLGLGDAKLLAALGAWTGPEHLPFLLMMASVGGIAYALIARLMVGRDLRAALPFGPFLSLGGSVMYCFTLTNYFG